MSGSHRFIFKLAQFGGFKMTTRGGKGAETAALLKNSMGSLGSDFRAQQNHQGYFGETPVYNPAAKEHDDKNLTYVDPMQNGGSLVKFVGHLNNPMGFNNDMSEYSSPPTFAGFTRLLCFNVNGSVLVPVVSLVIIIVNCIGIGFAFIYRHDIDVAATLPSFSIAPGDIAVPGFKKFIKYPAWFLYITPLAVSTGIVFLQALHIFLWKADKWKNVISTDTYLMSHSIGKGVAALSYAFTMPILSNSMFDFVSVVMIAAFVLLISVSTGIIDTFFMTSEWMNKGQNMVYIGRPLQDYDLTLFRFWYIAGKTPKDKYLQKFFYLCGLCVLFIISSIWVVLLSWNLFAFYDGVDTAIFSLFMILASPAIMYFLFYLNLAMYYNQFVSTSVYEICYQLWVHSWAPALFMIVNWWYYTGGDSRLFQSAVVYLP